MKYLFSIAFSLISVLLISQSITGKLLDPQNEPIIYANVSLHLNIDSSLVKVETTNEEGRYTFNFIDEGAYFIKASYVGMDDYQSESIDLNKETIDLGLSVMQTSAIELETATVTARRAMVEIKPDRTVFNVQGTINSTGDNGLELLRKAPGVLVDNNNNITVLSRTGVLVYIDGKRLPLQGDELTNYLQNLTADQIDRFDIITSPGAKYEAEGNAGIIDIRLKKNENYGANGSASFNYSQNKHARTNSSVSGNYRNKLANVFGQIGYNQGTSIQTFDFDDYQNNFRILESSSNEPQTTGYNLRLGTDFYVGKNSTVGFIVSSNINDTEQNSKNDSYIASAASPNVWDSILISTLTGEESLTVKHTILTTHSIKEKNHLMWI